MARKNPVQEFLDLKTKEAAGRAAQDLDLWNQWHSGGRTPEGLQPLIKRYEPLLARKTREWRAPAVAEAAFKMELKKHLIGAAETFDPERGVAFNTHLQNRLQKAKRFNAKYQNVGYIPEGQARNIGPLQAAQNELSEQFGREPTHSEIGAHLGMPVPKVTELMLAMRKDVPSSIFETDPAAFGTSRESDVIRLMQRSPTDYLTHEESQVFNHIYGPGGQPKGDTSTTALAARLGMSQPKISRLKTSIGSKIKKNM